MGTQICVSILSSFVGTLANEKFKKNADGGTKQFIITTNLDSLIIQVNYFKRRY